MRRSTRRATADGRIARTTSTDVILPLPATSDVICVMRLHRLIPRRQTRTRLSGSWPSECGKPRRPGSRPAGYGVGERAAEPSVERPLARREARGDRWRSPTRRHARPRRDRTSCGHGRGTRASSSSGDDVAGHLEVEVEVDPADQIRGSAVRTARQRAARRTRSRRCRRPHHTAPTTHRGRRPRARPGPRLQSTACWAAFAPSRRPRTRRRRRPGRQRAGAGRRTRCRRPTSASRRGRSGHFCWACNSAEKNSNAVFVFVC